MLQRQLAPQLPRQPIGGCASTPDRLDFGRRAPPWNTRRSVSRSRWIICSTCVRNPLLRALRCGWRRMTIPLASNSRPKRERLTPRLYAMRQLEILSIARTLLCWTHRFSATHRLAMPKLGIFATSKASWSPFALFHRKIGSTFIRPTSGFDPALGRSCWFISWPSGNAPPLYCLDVNPKLIAPNMKTARFFDQRDELGATVGERTGLQRQPCPQPLRRQLRVSQIVGLKTYLCFCVTTKALAFVNSSISGQQRSSRLLRKILRCGG